MATQERPVRVKIEADATDAKCKCCGCSKPATDWAKVAENIGMFAVCIVFVIFVLGPLFGGLS